MIRMARSNVFSVSLLLTLALTTATTAFAGEPKPAAPPNAPAGTLKDQLVGTWTLVESTMEFADGKKEEAGGGNEKGQAMFDAGGRFSWLIMGAARKPFKANNRMEGTLEEYKGAVQGTVAYWGTYTVDEAKKTVSFKIERSVFPNWDGTTREATITLTGDDLKQVNAPITTSKGTYTPKLTWKRAK